MTPSIAASPHLSPLVSESTASWTQSIRYVLTGRISSDWRNSIYKLITVFHVIAFAYCFFAGYWMLALIFLASIGADALIQRDIKDLGSHKALNVQYMEQNKNQFLLNFTYGELNRDQKKISVKLAKANTKLEETNTKLEKTSIKLEKAKAKIEEENKTFKLNNQTYGKLLSDMQNGFSDQQTQIDGLIQSGQVVNAAAKVKLEQTSRDLTARFGEINLLYTEQGKNTSKLLEDYSAKLSIANAEHIETITAATKAAKDLESATKELNKLQSEINRLNGELDRLKDETTRLTEVRKGFEATAHKLSGLVNQLSSFLPASLTSYLPKSFVKVPTPPANQVSVSA